MENKQAGQDLDAILEMANKVDFTVSKGNDKVQVSIPSTVHKEILYLADINS